LLWNLIFISAYASPVSSVTVVQEHNAQASIPPNAGKTFFFILKSPEVIYPADIVQISAG
jgi:hypothetical protein